MINAIRKEMNEYFIGKEDVVENVLLCLLAGGHVLLEDVPGVGKTTLARTLAGVMECDFGRIQFTPDTLPSDVLGTSIYNLKTGEFEFKKGSVMHQILLADEINRTSPKTQSALLEAMAEGQITVDDKVMPLPAPFMVLATQNPVEFLGTYPLPEAQMDRFMMKLTIAYPAPEAELRLAENFLAGKKPENIKAVCSAEDILSLRRDAEAVTLSAGILKYIREIIAATRKENRFVLGASPRAYLHLIRASQAKALLMGRNYVKPDDVKAVAINVLHHRLPLTSEAKIQKTDIDTLIKALVLGVIVPME